MTTLDRLAADAVRWTGSHRRSEIAAFCIALTFAIGYVDYVTGIWLSLSVVYIIPIALAAWYVNRWFAFLVAGLSTVVWIVGDTTANEYVIGFAVPAWNGIIRASLYVIVVLLIARLHSLQHRLASLVDERTQELKNEITDRKKLERDLLELSERERRSIGQDLHDGLCQHLAATALASQVLTQKLAQNHAAEAAESQGIVSLVEEGIALARGMAKGLHPVDAQPEGMMQALEELAASTSRLFRVSCTFDCDSPVLIHSSLVATNLYRIVQEAVSNALKHGHAARIVIAMETTDSGLTVSVRDDGVGLQEKAERKGMGLRIMAERAKFIGAVFSARRLETGGTEVACALPQGGASANLDDA